MVYFITKIVLHPSILERGLTLIMDDLFTRLEGQIRNLVDQQTELRQSNHQLQNSKGTLSREKEILLSRQQKTINIIEALVSKLKAIEKTS